MTASRAEVLEPSDSRMRIGGLYLTDLRYGPRRRKISPAVRLRRARRDHDNIAVRTSCRDRRPRNSPQSRSASCRFDQGPARISDEQPCAWRTRHDEPRLRHQDQAVRAIPPPAPIWTARNRRPARSASQGDCPVSSVLLPSRNEQRRLSDGLYPFLEELAGLRPHVLEWLEFVRPTRGGSLYADRRVSVGAEAHQVVADRAGAQHNALEFVERAFVRRQDLRDQQVAILGDSLMWYFAPAQLVF